MRRLKKAGNGQREKNERAILRRKRCELQFRLLFNDIEEAVLRVEMGRLRLLAMIHENPRKRLTVEIGED